MPREIKTTIAVDGEAAFKRAINEANTSMRNLGTQLTLAQANFKKDGDAMKLMETRSKTLKDEISQQNEIVKALEKAVTDSTKAYGENSDKAEKWQAELNRAKARLVNLQSELTLNEAGLDRNGTAFDNASDKAADFQATLATVGKNVAFENVSSGLGRVTKGFEDAVKKVWNFAVSLRNTMVDAGKWADDLLTNATKYGMDVEELQRWQNAADLIDTDVDTIITARDKLSRKMKEGWKDDGKDMFEFLKINLHDEDGSWRDTMDVMFELGEKLKNITWIDQNDVRATDWAMDVFGKSWRELLPLFTAGQEEWEKTVANQRVVSEEQVKALGEMDDANQNLENSWETLKMSAMARLAPAITTATDAMTSLLNQFNDWMETEDGKQAMDDLSESIANLFSGLKDIEFKDVVEAVKNAIDGVKNALNWIHENHENIKNALVIIAGGFAAIKLGQLATNITEIVSGFRALWAGANNKLPSFGGNGGTPASGGASGSGAGSAASGAGAGGSSSAAVNLGGIAGSGTSFSMMGGLSTVAPIVAFGALGVVGAKMIEANLNDPTLNQIYGDEEGKDLIDRMNEHMVEKAQKYWQVYTDEGKTGTEEAFQAREELQQAMEEGGIELTEQAVSLIENIFDEALKENDIDGMVAKTKELHPEIFEGLHTSSGIINNGGFSFMTLGAEIEKAVGDYMTQIPDIWSGRSSRSAILNNGGIGISSGAAEVLSSLLSTTPGGILQSLRSEMTDAQVAATEAWWDEFRKDAFSDEAGDAWDRLEETFAGNEDLLDRLDTALDNWMTDHEDNEFFNQEDLFSDAVAEIRMNTGEMKKDLGTLGAVDFKKFNGLPELMRAATQNGVSVGVSGIRVTLDGYTVGRLVAPYVSQEIAKAI